MSWAIAANNLRLMAELCPKVLPNAPSCASPDSLPRLGSPDHHPRNGPNFLWDQTIPPRLPLLLSTSWDISVENRERTFYHQSARHSFSAATLLYQLNWNRLGSLPNEKIHLNLCKRYRIDFKATTDTHAFFNDGNVGGSQF